MPLDPFQKKVLRLIAKNRNPESYVAEATVINRLPDSVRYSKDIDLFQDPSASVAMCARIDMETLRNEGLTVEVLLETSSFVRSVARSGSSSVRLEWATDTAFRFFPVVPDPDCGFRLHDIDAAINECLTLAGRQEARDVIDMLTVNDKLLAVGPCAWAACGKDPGYTPDLILDMLNRNARISPDLLSNELIREGVDLKKIKLRWIDALDEARKFVERAPSEQLGCLFLDKSGEVSRNPKVYTKPHRGTVRGSWPVIQSDG